MLLNRDEISEDKSFDLLTEAILDRDQPRTTDLFFQMVARDGRSLGEALGVVTAAEAPFVQVPSHINMRDGQITLINNDHTILGLRTSAEPDAVPARVAIACCRCCRASGTSRPGSTSGTSCSAATPAATPR